MTCRRPTASKYHVYFAAVDSARYVLPGRMDALVAQGRGAEIGALLGELRNGPAPSETPEERYGLNYVGGTTPAHVATALRAGYTTGCASAAFYRRSTVLRRLVGGDVETMAAVLSALDSSLDVAVTHRPFARLVVDGREVAAGEEADALNSAAKPKDSQGQPFGNESGNNYVLARDQCWAIPPDRR